jgi:hypothetical protein
VTDLVTRVLKIKDCGHDEYWLRDKIYDDPSILGLGDLQAVMKEKTQSQGGRLDLLLKDDDDLMYEVELQLGETDPSHIIRTIEYWDNEKRRWPSRSHKAVLVAERITSRFYNVIQLLSKAVPIVGVQANIVQVGEVRALHFTTIIDSYEEPEEEEELQQPSDEKDWLENHPRALECARWYRDLLAKFYGTVPMKFGRTVITLYVDGLVRVSVKQQKDRAVVKISRLDDVFAETVDFLTKEGVAFTPKGNESIKFKVDLQQLKNHQGAHERIAQRLAPHQLTSRQELTNS